MTIHEAFKAFKQADDKWQACLVKVFGKQAGDKRYQLDGQVHPECREAYQGFKQASAQWRRLIDEQRKEHDTCATTRSTP